MSKISVIIPIYNVEQYLPKCLDSVVNQTYKDLEIICVNDRSPDNSLSILEKYAQNDNRIKIVNRDKNGGLSAARNTGLSTATGEYVYFLDSDDWIDLDYLENMYNAIQRSNVEVVLNTNIIKEELGKPKIQFLPDLCPENINNICISANKCVWNIVWNTWAYFWKKSFLDRIKAQFPEGYLNEDMYFQATTLAFTDKIYVIRTSAYHYLVRNTGISANLKFSRKDEVLKIIKILNKTVDYFEAKEILNNINIKLFVLITIFDCEQRELLIDELQKYFSRVKVNVEKNIHLYNEIELELFNDVINNPERVAITNYYKKYLFHTLRKGLRV